MKIAIKSVFTNKTNEMDLPITPERIQAWRNSRTLIQDAFPDLTADQREFLLTGATPEEWKSVFGSGGE